MTKLDLTFQGLNQLINTHTPVDPEVAKVILRCTHKHDETILAQDFVKNERLNRLIQSMVKSGQANTISTLLAIDGLIGPKLNNGPQFEYKKYIENLKYSLSGEQGRYDREEEDVVKRTHVCATSSVHASKDSNGKNTEKEKDKTKFAKNENFAVSTIEQQYPLPTAPPSLPIGDELLQIRLTIIERRGKPQELQHPFSLNEDQI
ncbi:uncharacterized protein TNCV_4999161 [Trichonephila clavipes]|nr:uncharacterized protein TNCV_4999161 [Trichonephila clavipes]